MPCHEPVMRRYVSEPQKAGIDRNSSPEQEEPYHLGRSQTTRSWHLVRNPRDTWEDGVEHDVNALTPCDSVHSIPDACGESTVENWPSCAVDSKGGSTIDGERHVVY